MHAIVRKADPERDGVWVTPIEDDCGEVVCVVVWYQYLIVFLFNADIWGLDLYACVCVCVCVFQNLIGCKCMSLCSFVRAMYTLL